ncbi:hypothetical protein BDQ12DRAFT_665513 [Crucibulum laeve]|uniref:Uncharacterized protein n=1 Tax=Crucibulum laeve TaxID=68775 RepID=A0A5C3M176_9AGAR|nr:hypothetical protein BDQ12DRAFT_665513 [Crucibulum laeve]
MPGNQQCFTVPISSLEPTLQEELKQKAISERNSDFQINNLDKESDTVYYIVVDPPVSEFPNDRMEERPHNSVNRHHTDSLANSFLGAHQESHIKASSPISHQHHIPHITVSAGNSVSGDSVHTGHDGPLHSIMPEATMLGSYIGRNTFHPAFGIEDPRGENYESRINRPDLNSPLEWIRFLTCLNDMGLCALHVVEMHWYKQPRFPGHEYIVLGFAETLKMEEDDGRSVPVYGDARVWMRLERDTGSWFTILAQMNRIPQNCQDKATVSQRFDELVTRDQIRLASLVVKSDMQSFIAPLHIVLLLRILREKVSLYDFVTFNCWWFAGCIWENISYWVRMSGLGANLTLMTGGADKLLRADAVTEVHEHSQLQTISRGAPNNHERFAQVAEASQEIREYCQKKLLDDAYNLAESTQFIEDAESFLELNELAQTAGRMDPEFNEILYVDF